MASMANAGRQECARAFSCCRGNFGSCFSKTAMGSRDRQARLGPGRWSGTSNILTQVGRDAAGNKKGDAKPEGVAISRLSMQAMFVLSRRIVRSSGNESDKKIFSLKERILTCKCQTTHRAIVYNTVALTPITTITITVIGMSSHLHICRAGGT